MLIVTLPLQGVLPKHLPPRADLTRAKKPRRANRGATTIILSEQLTENEGPEFLSAPDFPTAPPLHNKKRHPAKPGCYET